MVLEDTPNPALMGKQSGLVRINGSLRQYFSLYRAVSQRDGESCCIVVLRPR